MVIVVRLTGPRAFSVAVSSGFIARLDFGELARWGRIVAREIRSQRSEIDKLFSVL
jgi:hypothetical protein